MGDTVDRFYERSNTGTKSEGCDFCRAAPATLHIFICANQIERDDRRLRKTYRDLCGPCGVRMFNHLETELAA